MKRCIALITAMSLASSGFAQNLPDLGESAQAGLSIQNERRVGEMIMRELRRDPAFLDDVEVQGYVESLGTKLVAVSTESRQDFEFFVVKDPTINAFAMPGGFVGIHTGLLLAAQTEAELASVLAHEVAHVTQRHIARNLERQSQLQVAALAGLLIALLAARSNSQVGQAALATSQAGVIQAALNYSRDFEREADRVGFQLLEQAGYDVNGMPSFFDRLSRATRLQDNNAPAYLRTHPLNTERIADMQNRAATARYRQQADSLDFHLVRAKLRATAGNPREAIAMFEGQLKERRFTSEGATLYGLAYASLQVRDFKRAETELSGARKLLGRHAMLDTLGAAIQLAAGQTGAARETLALAMKEHPGRTAVAIAYVEALQASGRHGEALGVLEGLVRVRSRDPRVHGLQAKSYAASGKRALQHRSQAEVYYLQGALPAAIEQLRLAQNAGDADFHTLSGIDARWRELRALHAEERKRERELRLAP